MILIVLEGAIREPNLFNTLTSLYFQHPSGNDEVFVQYIYGTTFHTLYKNMKDSDMELLEHLREKAKNNKNKDLKHNYETFLQYNEADFSEIYLFFDYDFHNKNKSQMDKWNNELQHMLESFGNESDGKLYINYPMVESIRYTKRLPDANYRNYIATKSDCLNFKRIAADFSEYKGLNFIQTNASKKATEIMQVKQNWEYLKEQNVKKANFICQNEYSMPERKVNVNQQLIFKNQLDKFVNPCECCSILNSFPIFLYEYFK